MGSGSSSQVKTIESKSIDKKGSAVNEDDLPDNESATLKKKVSRAMPYPHTPGTGHSEKTDPGPHDLVRKPSSSSLRQSSGDHMMTVTKALPHRQETAYAASSSSSSDLQQKLDQLQTELNESESEKLDLQDRIQALEEKLQVVMSSAAPLAPPPDVGGCAEWMKRGGGDSAGRGGLVRGGGAPLEQTLHAKDQYIQQMEKQLAAAEAQLKKVRVRLKKRIKGLMCELNEARQEASITQLEMRERQQDLQQQLSSSTTTASTATQGKESNPTTETPAAAAAADKDSDHDHPDSKMKIILDLSEEVSEQSQRIALLERQLKEKDRELEQLKKQRQASDSLSRSQERTVETKNNANNSNSNNSNDYYNQAAGRSSSVWQQMQQEQDKKRPDPNLRQTGLAEGATVAPVETTGMDYYRIPGGSSFAGRPVSKISGRPIPPQPSRQSRIAPEDHLSLQRQSTALSDSDSDWELETPTSKIHSAPARVRVKSAALIAEDQAYSSTHRPPQRVDNKWSVVATDDNDLTMSSEVGGAGETIKMERENSGRARRRQKRKSALKSRLERDRDERALGLMGPTLAFAAPAADQLSDISSTPTPRHSVSDMGSQQFNSSEVKAFN